MDNADLARILSAYHEFLTKAVPEVESGSTCLRLSRLRKAVLNPDALSGREKRHLEKFCQRCGDVMDLFRKHQWHPNPLELFREKLRNKSTANTDIIKRHLVMDMCEYCSATLRWFEKVPYFEHQIESARTGEMDAIIRARAKLHRTVLSGVQSAGCAPGTGVILLPAASSSRSSLSKPLSAAQHLSPDGSLSVTLRETERRSLIVVAETSDSHLWTQAVRISLTDAKGKEVIHGILAFLERSAGCFISYMRLGDTDSIAAQVDRRCRIYAVPLTQAEILKDDIHTIHETLQTLGETSPVKKALERWVHGIPEPMTMEGEQEMYGDSENGMNYKK